MANLSDKIKLGKSLFNADRETGQSTIAATATADSSDGMVTVTIGGEQVAIPTIGAVSAGDTVQVDVRDGKPVAIGSAGWGDDIQDDVDETTNHFWTDQSLGAVVSKNEQPADPSTLTGANTVLGSSGMSIRDGQTVLAKFASSMIELGKNSINAVISLCGGFATITASTDSTSGKLRIQPVIQSQIGSNARIDAGYSALNEGKFGRISMSAGDDSGSRHLNYASVSVNAARYYDEDGTRVAFPENVFVASRGYTGYIYGWTCIVNGTAGTASSAIDISYAQEIMIAACNSSGPTYLTATIPIQLIGSTQSEYRLTGGFSDSTTTGMHHANVKLSKTLFSPQWYYRNSQDATSISTFYLFAR